MNIADYWITAFITAGICSVTYFAAAGLSIIVFTCWMRSR